MDLDALKTFLAVSDYKNFTKAAERMYCTQAAVSMRIKKMENGLACQLFERHGKEVTLTKEGQVLLPYAKQIVNTWEGAQAHLLQSRLMEQSEIHITSSSTPGTYIIPSIMYLFRQQYPYITVLNHVQYTKSAVQAVISGKFAIGIVSQPVLSDTKELTCEPLMEDPLVLVVAPKHPWADKKVIPIRLLKEETLLVSNPNTSLVAYLERLGGYHFDPANLYVAGHIEAIKRGIIGGQGVSVMSAYAVRQELELGLLKRVAFADDIKPVRKIYLIKRADEEPKLSTQLFVDFFRSAAEENTIGLHT